MMWLVILAWIVLLGAAALFAQAFGFNLDEAPKLFLALPAPQQITFAIAALVALFLIVASVWQSEALTRRTKISKNLQRTVDGLRNETARADEVQRNFEAAGEHLNAIDPVDVIQSLQSRLTESEQRVAFQKSRNESVDLRERLQDIRLRQQALRKQIGEVGETRRTIEPIFGELKERQGQLEQSLADIETDDNKNSLAGRLKQVSGDVVQIQARLKALMESWETLSRFKEEFGASQTQLVRLQAPDAGLAALIIELHARRDELAQTLGALETHGEEKLAARVEALARSKLETEQRIASLDNCFAILDTVRRDFGELEERRAHLTQALAQVETDPSGRKLADRQTELNEFAAQTRVRVRVLQDSSTALSGFKQEIDKSQAALVPLQSAVDGIEALIADLHGRRDRLVKSLSEIELHGDEKLSTRVEALYRSKIETEQRVAQVVEQFAKLDSIRTEIGGLFTKLNGTLDRLR
jgi:chromosome segregation ATPase